MYLCYNSTGKQACLALTMNLMVISVKLIIDKSLFIKLYLVFLLCNIKFELNALLLRCKLNYVSHKYEFNSYSYYYLLVFRLLVIVTSDELLVCLPTILLLRFHIYQIQITTLIKCNFMVALDIFLYERPNSGQEQYRSLLPMNKKNE